MDKKEQIYGIIADHLNVKKEDFDDNSLIEDLGGDSLDVIEIIVEIETQFNTEVTENIHSVKTVGDIVKLIEK